MVESFVIDKAVNLVFFCEALDGVHLVLHDAAVEVAGDADIESARSAGQDVNPESVVEAVAHGRNGNTGCAVKIVKERFW